MRKWEERRRQTRDENQETSDEGREMRSSDENQIREMMGPGDQRIRISGYQGYRGVGGLRFGEAELLHTVPEGVTTDI